VTSRLGAGTETRLEGTGQSRKKRLGRPEVRAITDQVPAERSELNDEQFTRCRHGERGRRKARLHRRASFGKRLWDFV